MLGFFKGDSSKSDCKVDLFLSTSDLALQLLLVAGRVGGLGDNVRGSCTRVLLRTSLFELRRGASRLPTFIFTSSASIYSRPVAKRVEQLLGGGSNDHVGDDAKMTALL